MNHIKLFVIFILFSFTISSFANGLKHPYSSSPSSPSSSQLGCAACGYNSGYNTYARQVSVILYPGSLKDNIRSIARQNGWSNVAWGRGCNIDYRWLGRTKVTGASFPDVLRKILVGYPLQAVFYKGNHILVIKPRTLK